MLRLVVRLVLRLVLRLVVCRVAYWEALRQKAQCSPRWYLSPLEA